MNDDASKSTVQTTKSDFNVRRISKLNNKRNTTGLVSLSPRPIVATKNKINL